MIQMWLFACKSVNRFACCICYCFNFALLFQDHGFDPSYGSNHLPIVNFHYAYTETSKLKEIIWDTAELNDCRRTQHMEDQHGLVKLTRVTLYWTFLTFLTQETVSFFKWAEWGFQNNAYRLSRPLLFSPRSRSPLILLVACSLFRSSSLTKSWNRLGCQ